PEYFYECVAPTLARADLRFGNLEWPLASAYPVDSARVAYHAAMRAHANPPAALYTGPRMDPGAIEMLRRAGYDAVSLANNHHMDFGPQGSRDTMGLLDAAGIGHSGAGENLAEATRP